MPSETLRRLDAFRLKPDRQKMENREEFRRIASKCEHRKDNSSKHGMYAQIPACKASGIRTLKACDIDDCPAMY